VHTARKSLFEKQISRRATSTKMTGGGSGDPSPASLDLRGYIAGEKKLRLGGRGDLVKDRYNGKKLL